MDALLGELPELTGEEKVESLDLRLIDNNPSQPRREFDSEKLGELAESIKAHGVFQPIIVVKNGERYTIVAGERRFRASKLAGKESIPAIVRDLETRTQQEIALIENIQREDLNPIEEAMAIRALVERYGLTHEEVSQRVGKSRSAVTNAMRLLGLPEAVRAMVRTGELTTGHAKVLLAVKDEAECARLGESAARGGWTVRELEEKVEQSEGKQEKKKRAKAKARAAAKPAIMAEVEEQLRRELGMRVEIRGDENSGTLTISYSDSCELDELFVRLCPCGID